jgi:branched-chain amino acid transport system permease protein
MSAIPTEAADMPSRRSPRTGFILLALVAAALLVAPMWVYPIFMMKLLCFALFAAAFNLLLGYTGLLSFGHAAFFGGAAYVTAHAMKVWQVTPEVAILAGVGAAIVLGLIIGAIAIRRQGIYFAMITLALAQMFYFFCLQVPFTNGEDGIQGFSRGKLFGLIDLNDTMNLYYFIAVMTVLSLMLIWRIVHSPFGQILKAIRENEPRTISLGYSVQRYKLAAFVMSAGLAGLAGSMAGPVVGAGILVGLQNFFATSGFPVTIVLGATFMICVLLFRRGVVGEVRHWLDNRKA